METVGQIVRRRREELGLTLSALAAATGAAKSYLSMIENHRVDNPPSREVLAALERALKLEHGELRAAADWALTPPEVRAQVQQLSDDARRAAEVLRWLKQSTSRKAGGGKNLDKLWKSGALRRQIDRVLDEPPPIAGPGRGDVTPWGRTRGRIPLINKVSAGYPEGFTDLDYPARVADDYIASDVDDPDAFAATVVGDSMAPEYKAGDIIVLSPAAPITDGCDCFVRLEPDHECTFKRVFIDAETGRIRLQPLNPAYPARTVDRDAVAGMYRVVRQIIPR